MIAKAFSTRTDDGILGPSGRTIKVYGMHIISGAGGGGVVALKNGTTTAGSTVKSDTGTASVGITFDYSTAPYMFGDGCFADVDANVTRVTIFYEVV